MEYADYLFFLGRVLYGGYFLMMGVNHFARNGMLAGYAASRGVPMPKLAVYGSGILILLGGLGVLVGTYVRGAVALIAIFLLVVTFKMHAYWKDADPMAKMGNMINFQKNLALLGAALTMLAIPEPWLWSIF